MTLEASTIFSAVVQKALVLPNINITQACTELIFIYLFIFFLEKDLLLLG